MHTYASIHTHMHHCLISHRKKSAGNRLLTLYTWSIGQIDFQYSPPLPAYYVTSSEFLKILREVFGNYNAVEMPTFLLSLQEWAKNVVVHKYSPNEHTCKV